MRYLKRKVRLIEDDTDSDSKCLSDFQIKQEPEQECSERAKSEALSMSAFEIPTPITKHSKSDITIPLRGPRRTRTQPNADSKNIIKNYGKALCSFASSGLAVPYIHDIIRKNRYNNFDTPKFMEQMKDKKTTTNSIENIRHLLIEKDTDSEEQRIHKRVFKEVSVIFMKYFSVNWIFGGKLFHKTVHLKFRFKMLRRIQNPELFTYLKTSMRGL